MADDYAKLLDELEAAYEEALNSPMGVHSEAFLAGVLESFRTLLRLSRRGLAAGEVVEAANELMARANQARIDMQRWGAQEDGIPAEYSDNWEHIREAEKKYTAALARLAAKEGA